MVRHRVGIVVPLSLALVSVVVAVATAGLLVTPEAVVTGKGDQWMPSANDEWVAYSHWVRSSPNQFSAYALNVASQTKVKLNEAGTDGLTGALDPGTNIVLYQQWDGRRSDLFFRDLDGDTRTKVAGVNSRYWEWYPLISSSFITFFRDRYVNGAWYTSMYVYRRDNEATRKLWTYRWTQVHSYNGSAGERYITYTLCRTTCQAYLYDWDEKDTRKIPSDGMEQYAPVVDEVNGTVYVTRSGGRCGVGVNVYRLPITLDAAAETVVDLPAGIDTGWTSAIAPNGVSGMMDLWFERWDCERKAADVYVARGVDNGPL